MAKEFALCLAGIIILLVFPLFFVQLPACNFP